MTAREEEVLALARRVFVVEGHRTYFAEHPSIVGLQLVDIIEELRGERDEANELLGRAAINMPERMRTAAKLPENITALRAERDKLREALKPFADVAPHYEGTRDDYVVIRHIGESGDHPLVVADFRRALSLKETAP